MKIILHGKIYRARPAMVNRYGNCTCNKCGEKIKEGEGRMLHGSNKKYAHFKCLESHEEIVELVTVKNVHRHFPISDKGLS